MRPLFYALVLLLAGFHDGAFAQPYEQVRGVIHLDSSISGGEYEPEDLVQLLRKNKLQIAIFTDQATTRVEYGFFPVRWIMGWFTGWAAAKATGRTGSVETFGAVNYLDLLAAIDTKYPDTIVIPGVESFPFYYWQGSPLSGNLTMVNGYKHLLAVGMPATEDYEGLPSMSNGFFRGFGLESLLSLWPLVLLFLGYKCRKRSHSADWPLLFTLPAFLFLGTGILFLLHNFPFQFGKYDQYHGDQGLAPYQDFINYVEDRGGLVFWAHPEISKDQVIKKGPMSARLYTEAYFADLLFTYNYTGFAAFYEGMKYVIPPGGVWDRILAQYCTGKRLKPVWAIGEGDVEGDLFSPNLSQTVFLLKDRSQSSVLQSLREGRIYPVAGPLADSLILSDLSLTSGDSTVGMGQILKTKTGDIHFSAVLTCATSRPNSNALKADLIRDGKVVQTFKGEGKLPISFRESVPEDGRMHYYRLDVYAPKQTRLLSNPVFVHRQ